MEISCYTYFTIILKIPKEKESVAVYHSIGLISQD